MRSGGWADVGRFLVFSEGPAGSSEEAVAAVMTLPLTRRAVSSRTVGVGYLVGNRTIGADVLHSGLVSTPGSRLSQEQLIFKSHGGSSAPPGLGWETHPDSRILRAVLSSVGPEPAESRSRHRCVGREKERA